jgi:pimeloyl-ACP methyl ester carboxylesterase
MKLLDRTIQVRGEPIRYKTAGSGEPLILVHGLSGSTRWWVRNIPAFAERYTVYLVDLPGFGTLARTQRFVLSEAADWLLDWFHAIDLERADWLGHSMGGYLCLQVAARLPQVVDRLVLAAPALLPTGHSWESYLLPLMAATRYMPPSFLPILLTDALRAGPLTILRAARDLLSKDIRKEVCAVQSPSLLIWGQNDTLVPPILGDLLHKAIPHSRLLILKGAGHVLMYDRPHAFNDAILKFLSGQPPASKQGDLAVALK